MEVDEDFPTECRLYNPITDSIRSGYQRFVRATNSGAEASVGDTETIEATKGDGERTKKFYDETISKSDKKAGSTLNKVETIDLSDSSDDDIEVVDNKANKELLIAVQNGDLNSVKKMKYCDYNHMDEYGWTVLEIAAVQGHGKIVRYLLKKNAYIEDNQKIFDILLKKGLFNIISILCEGQMRKEPNVIDLVSSGGSSIVTCNQCSIEYKEGEMEKHLTSIPHLLSSSSSNISLNPGFGIAEGNLGFRMLQRVGWDGRSGLGESRKGRLFPVKTSLRYGRMGLAEGDKRGARITHRHEEILSLGKRNEHRRQKGLVMNKLDRREKRLKANIILSEKRLREDIGEL